jgi:pilus assembly protein CpaE
VIGRSNDITLYRDLIARGVSDYLVSPINKLAFIQSLSNLYTSPTTALMGRVIAVTGSKGGVGSSTIAHNLAWSLSRNADMATILVDMDLGFGTAGLDFNQDPPQSIADAVYSPDRLDANLLDRLMSKCTDKLSILAAPATLDRLYDFPETAFDGLIDLLRSSTPIIVLDVPHAWTAWSRRMLVGADDLVIVGSPDLASLRNTKNLIDGLKSSRPNDSKPKLVMNMIGVPKRPEINVVDFAKALELDPIGVVAFEPKLFGTAANNGQMLSEVDPKSKISEMIDDISSALMGRSEVRNQKRSLLQPLVSRFRRKKVS